MCPFLPDSPRLLIRKGKHEEALEVIAALEGHGATPESPEVVTQYNIIKDILDREHMNTYTWWQLLSGKGPNGVLRRMLLGAWMQAMNQISGINVGVKWATCSVRMHFNKNQVTSYYMSYIFINSLGITELISRILAAAGSVDYLIFATLAYFVIERYGRRKVGTSQDLWVALTRCRFLCLLLQRVPYAGLSLRQLKVRPKLVETPTSLAS